MAKAIFDVPEADVGGAETTGDAAGTAGDAAGTARAIAKVGGKQPSAIRLAAAAIGASGPGRAGRAATAAAPAPVAAAAMAAGHSRRERGMRNPEVLAG